MANIALRAARNASPVILQGMDRVDLLQKEEKSGFDFVSDIDREAEQIIIETINRSYPDHTIIGEESGTVVKGDLDYTWIIDPLDGTTNYLNGIPHFCISIACLKGKQFEHAVVLDPLQNEEFVASKGFGSQLNGKRIRVSKPKPLHKSILATGIPPLAKKDHVGTYMKTLDSLLEKSGAIRRMGSAALDLAYVAAGRFDGFWEFKLSPWDIAAGTLLVREAGGFVGDLSGGDNFYATRNIIAANPSCFKAIVRDIDGKLSQELT